MLVNCHSQIMIDHIWIRGRGHLPSIVASFWVCSLLHTHLQRPCYYLLKFRTSTQSTPFLFDIKRTWVILSIANRSTHSLIHLKMIASSSTRGRPAAKMWPINWAGAHPFPVSSCGGIVINPFLRSMTVWMSNALNPNLLLWVGQGWSRTLNTANLPTVLAMLDTVGWCPKHCHGIFGPPPWPRPLRPRRFFNSPWLNYR